MRRQRRMKVVATLGPASAAPEMLERLVNAGVDVFRINMSHTTHDVAREMLYALRRLGKQIRHPIGILADLQGPKFRVGQFKDEQIQLQPNNIFTFDQDKKPGSNKRVYLPHPPIFEAVKADHLLLLDDGKLRFRVLEATCDKITAEVLNAGTLASRKGITLPNTVVPVSPLTEKDEADLDLALDLGADWIALSFIQRAADVAEISSRIDEQSAVMVKIERPTALDELDEIIALADGLMVARGDLGVELPLETVPRLQKRIIRKARAAGKPVVVATQMLESMISSPIPTRAEVSDVANAVFEGADAVMLSAESAVGNYPVEAINMMDKIAADVENDKTYESVVHAISTPPQATAADAIATAAYAIARTVKLSAIVCFTARGASALRVARERPGLAVLGLTPIPSVAHRMSIVWGVQSVLTSDPENLSDMVRKACRIAFEEGLVKAGEGILVLAGVPFGAPGSTNMIRIAFVNENGEPIDGE